MPRGRLEIGIYEPPAPLDSAIPERAVGPRWVHGTTWSGSRRSVARFLVVATGAFASILLHAALVTSLTWSGHQRQAPVPGQQNLVAPGNHDEQNDRLTMELVEVEETSSREEMLTTPRLTVVTLEAALADATIPPVSDPEEDVNEAEIPARSPLVGRYLGQINARIERAWRRPRTPLDDGLFSCRVRIEQDTGGGVKEIALEHCNGDASWQLSLVHAIQSASPLPVPSDPSVFKPILRIDFRAEPYSARALQDDYEPIRQ